MGSNDLGLAANSRVNVGVYNGGAVEATATIELRRGCDDGVIQQRTVTIPANTVIQFSGFTNDTSAHGVGCSPPLYTTYVVVTANQPSFSYAATASNERPPKIPLSISSQ